jgi:hypothetical protein
MRSDQVMQIHTDGSNTNKIARLLTALRFLRSTSKCFVAKSPPRDKQNSQRGSRARFSLLPCHPYVGFQFAKQIAGPVAAISYPQHDGQGCAAPHHVESR